VAPPGFCNRGEVRYGSIGGLEYEVPQSRLYCLNLSAYQRGSLLDGLAMYSSCDTKKFHDNESTHILHNFWTSTHRGEAPPFPPLAAPLQVSSQAENLPFLQILPTAASLFFFRTDYMDSPDCLLTLLSISVFLHFSFFLFSTF